MAPKYPRTPDEINLPTPSGESPDQGFYFTFLVQHNRLWVMLSVSILLNLLLVWGMIQQTRKYQPSEKLITLSGGLPMLTDTLTGRVMIDSVAYSAPGVQAIVDDYVDSRYAWDFRDPTKYRNALPYLSKEGQTQVLEQLGKLNIATTIIGAQRRVRLKTEPNFTVIPRKTADGRFSGEFKITVRGLASINDALNYPDPAHPLEKRFEIILILKTVERTKSNLTGYLITSSSEDIF